MSVDRLLNVLRARRASLLGPLVSAIDVWDAPTPEARSHVSLTRLYQESLQTPGTTSWALLTVWKGSAVREDNLHRVHQLQQTLRSWRLGYLPCRGVTYADQEEPQAMATTVPYWWVRNLSLAKTQALVTRYHQPAVYSGAAMGETTLWLGPDVPPRDLGPFDPLVVVQAFSEFEGRAPHFDCGPLSFFEGVALQAHRARKR